MHRRIPLSVLLLLLLLLRALCRVCADEQRCPPGTYRKKLDSLCESCRVCDGPQLEYVQNCSEIADAICKCIPEYSCGKKAGECGKCHCAPGQEQTREGCQSCPEGTFNDLATGQCRPWTLCPANKILTPGTKEADVNCTPEGQGPTHTPRTVVVDSTKVEEIDSQLIPVSIALILVLLLCVLMLLLSCIFIRSGARGKLLKLPHEQLAQEVDDCSYRYPEEEEGEHTEATGGLKGELLENIP